MLPPARAQGFDPFPPSDDAVVATCAARGHSEATPGTTPAERLSWCCASTGSRSSFGRRTAGSRNWRTPNTGSRMQLQKFRQDVEFRFGERSGRRSRRRRRRRGARDGRPKLCRGVRRQQGREGRTRSIPMPDRTRRARRSRSERLRRARRSCSPASPPAGTPLELGKGPAPASPPPAAAGPTDRRLRRRDAGPPREQFNAALQAFQSGAISGGRRRVQGVSCPPIRRIG